MVKSFAADNRHVENAVAQHLTDKDEVDLLPARFVLHGETLILGNEFRDVE